jgi:RNA polymerase sigma-70 factor (ECF subfamily)
MLPVREPHSGEEQYNENLALIRRRILGYALRRLVPHEADHAEAEEIAQSCIAALWEQYPDKQDIAEMTGIALGIARNKIGQFRRDRAKLALAAADAPARDPAIDPLERAAARQTVDRFLRAMLQLPPRCRELLRLKLIEQADYPEIRMRMGISGNIYEMAKRCHRTLLRLAGGAVK